MDTGKAEYHLPFDVSIGGMTVTSYNGPGTYQGCLDEIAKARLSSFSREIARTQLKNAHDWYMGNPLNAAKEISERPSQLDVALERLLDSDLDLK